MRALITFFLVGASHAQTIQFVGGTRPSKFIVGQMSEKNYVQTLLALKQQFDTQVVKSMSDFENRAKRLTLKKFTLGIGSNAEIGVGPFKYGTALKQRFGYTR